MRMAVLEMPFGQVPVLKIGETQTISETKAILRFFGKQFGWNSPKSLFFYESLYAYIVCNLEDKSYFGMHYYLN